VLRYVQSDSNRDRRDAFSFDGALHERD
jgi:hypothetical protein